MTTTTKPGTYDIKEFIHRGKTRKIFRRFPQGNFCIRRQVAGKDLLKTLDTPLATIAIQNAKGWLDTVTLAAVSDKWEALDPMRSKTSWPLLSDIAERYAARAAAAGDIAPRTVAGNVSSFAALLRLATQQPLGELRADCLTEITLRRFVEAARAAGRSESGIKSVLRQSRSLFAGSVLYIYAAAPALKIPDLAGWKTKIKFDTAADLGFAPFPQETETAMEQAAVALRQADPATWLCYMLMSRTGLRNIEAERITLADLRPDHAGNWHIHIPRTKDGDARAIALPDDLPATEIQRIAGDGPHIVPATTRTQRRDICQRSINRFVRRFLPDREKAAYELRKWSGSLVWTEQGAEAAQAFLGHRDITTTQRYYARFLRPVRAVSAADRAASIQPLRIVA